MIAQLWQLIWPPSSQSHFSDSFEFSWPTLMSFRASPRPDLRPSQELLRWVPDFGRCLRTGPHLAGIEVPRWLWVECRLVSGDLLRHYRMHSAQAAGETDSALG
uniref:(northern house mosquito) hypothetical protein n=1 Tax=Culex pipiens TaxID=7175 RepID=A0A8D7ZSY0_CULPI